MSIRSLFAYFRFLRDSKKEVIIAIVLGIIYGLSSGFGVPAILKYSSSVLFSDREVRGIVLIFFSLLPVCVMLIRGITGFLSSYYFAACGQRIVEALRMMIFQKIQRLHLGFFNSCPPAELISRSINASTIIQNNLVDISHDIVTQPTALLGAIGYLVYLCIQESDLVILLLFLTALPLSILPIRNIGQRLRKKSGLMQSRTAAIIDRLNHNLAAVKEVRAFCLEKQEIDHYRRACHAFSEAFLKVVKYQLIVGPIVEIIAAMGIGFSMFYAHKQGLKLEIFISLATALYFGYDAVKRLGDLNNKIQGSMAAVDRIESVLSEPEEISDPSDPMPVGKLRGDIEFRDVTFSYLRHKDVLKKINVRMEHGKIYALVGSSGAGKSTFANMILRFFDVDRGSITIDGIDIREMLKCDLRRNIAYIPQDPVLINDTVCNNIMWGKPGATREEVIEAAKKAHAHDFIMQMPQGYDTLIGEDGGCISGGQRQRMALARVFLRNCPILIFDEATSALDVESQDAIYKAIKDLAHERTIIMISHRFTMMAVVDEIFVFSQGQIVERGTHRSLLDGDTLYRRLYEKSEII